MLFREFLTFQHSIVELVENLRARRAGEADYILHRLKHCLAVVFAVSLQWLPDKLPSLTAPRNATPLTCEVRRFDLQSCKAFRRPHNL